jgi:hypothetical protein
MKNKWIVPFNIQRLLIKPFGKLKIITQSILEPNIQVWQNAPFELLFEKTVKFVLKKSCDA